MRTNLETYKTAIWQYVMCVVCSPNMMTSVTYLCTCSHEVDILPNIFQLQCEIKGLHISLTVMLQGNTFVLTLVVMQRSHCIRLQYIVTLRRPVAFRCVAFKIVK